MRSGVPLLLLVLGSGHAFAQPANPATPPAPAPPAPAPGPEDPYAVAPGQDPMLTEHVAGQLVARAQELFDAKMYVDAKQLAVEALVESPKGVAADAARSIIRQVNQVLGIQDDPVPALPDKPDVSPIEDPTKLAKHVETATPTLAHDGKMAAGVHGVLYGGVVGAAIGSLFSSSKPAEGAVPVGLAAAVGGALIAPRLTERLHWDEAQIRTTGSGSVWGGVAGGFFADVVLGSNGGHTTAPGVLIGSSIGATVGLAGGAYYARRHELTRGDVALIDTLAGMGTVGGLTIGMLMQPAQPEAYSLNAVIGAVGGVVVGVVAAPQTNTTPRRMLRVAGVAAAGGAVPLVILAAGPHRSGVQRAAGGLSAAGMIAGAWLGFYLTRNLDVGLDVPDHVERASDSPPAVVGRDSDGHWHLGGFALAPLSPELASHQQGMTFTVLAGTLK
jgi:hypothetical protein